MSWPEVNTAKSEARHELVLTGAPISKRIDQAGLDKTLFSIITLNYLNISETTLATIPDDIGKLLNLQTLVLHSNKLTELNENVGKLSKLKVLDVSRNQLESLPEGIGGLENLNSLNASSNCLNGFIKLEKNGKLLVLDLANNKLTEFPEICTQELAGLTDLSLNGNEIEVIPDGIKLLSSLKNVNFSNNKIKVIPGELVDCNKIKEINLKENPVTDRRLLKLINQCRTKQVMDYVKQNCKRNTTAESKPSGKGKKGKQEDEVIEETTPDYKYKLVVQHVEDETVRVILQENVKKVRGHILACLIKNMEFTPEKLKKFIQMQTKLHEGICDKRNAATIATHDADVIVKGNVTYTALPPGELLIKPLNRNKAMTGEELFSHLQNEAETLRKEKKRNVYSGIHKYLYLLEGQKFYPCLVDASQQVISFPPITNSDVTKISVTTKNILVEVTSATSQVICKKVLDAFLKETITVLETDLTVQQIKSTDPDGNLKSVYPSKTDLVYEDNTSIQIVRE